MAGVAAAGVGRADAVINRLKFSDVRDVGAR